jgi:hypothetical protein
MLIGVSRGVTTIVVTSTGGLAAGGGGGLLQPSISATITNADTSLAKFCREDTDKEKINLVTAMKNSNLNLASQSSIRALNKQYQPLNAAIIL